MKHKKQLWQQLLTTPLALRLHCYSKKSFRHTLHGMEKAICRTQQGSHALLRTDYLE